MCRVETGGNRRVVDGVLKMTGLTEDERLNVLRNNDQLKKERELGKVFLVSPSPLSKYNNDGNNSNNKFAFQLMMS